MPPMDRLPSCRARPAWETGRLRRGCHRRRFACCVRDHPRLARRQGCSCKMPGILQ